MNHIFRPGNRPGIRRDIPDIAANDPRVRKDFDLREVFRYIESRGASVVKTATFLDKPKARKVPFNADYIGFSIEPQFVVGYGLDFAERYRNLPFVGVLKPQIFQTRSKPG